jgi:translation initiation factor 3 subunit M
MVETDSVSIFAEGTFEEQVQLVDSTLKSCQCLSQIQELVNYLVRNRSEEERNAFIRPFQDALKTHNAKKLDEYEKGKRVVFGMVLKEVKGLGEGNDKGKDKKYSAYFRPQRTIF